MISSLVDAVLHFELLNSKDDLEKSIGEIVVETRFTHSRRQWGHDL